MLLGALHQFVVDDDDDGSETEIATILMPDEDRDPVGQASWWSTCYEWRLRAVSRILILTNAGSAVFHCVMCYITEQASNQISRLEKK